MSRRKQTRRRQRDARRDRSPADGPAAAAPPPPGPRDISWPGVAGGGLGLLILGQAVVYNLVTTDGSLLVAATLAAIALLYAGAVWVSLRATAARRAVLRWVVAFTMACIVLGAIFIDIAVATLLLAPSTLLAIAAGLIFQRRVGA